MGFSILSIRYYLTVLLLLSLVTYGLSIRAALFRSGRSAPSDSIYEVNEADNSIRPAFSVLRSENGQMPWLVHPIWSRFIRPMQNPSLPDQSS
uniref:Uncharacterized protein n=1 Tax=Acrobeloides nanus TaxID=290746 RepID=A0A914CU59_9BILA